MSQDTLEELKKEATDLGIAFSANIGEAKLQEKIDAYYEKKAVADTVPEISVKNKAITTEKEDPELIWKRHILKQREDAYKTRIVVIVDNDQRENSHNSTCSVNCSNEHFDLGTISIPLNIPVEVKQGHIDVLLSIKIPMHVKNPSTGLAETVLRHRYSILYEDGK